MSTWPTTLTAGPPDLPIVLRPLRRQDRHDWERLRQADAAYLARWEPTPPDGVVRSMSFAAYVRHQNRQGREGSTLPFAIDIGGRVAGQMQLFGVSRGSLQSGMAGYWVASQVAGRGVATHALAALTTYALGPFGLHRVEVNIRPENTASLRVVEHLGFRYEGVRARLLHIEGDWRDHHSFALTREDTGGRPVIDRWSGGVPSVERPGSTG